MDENNYRRTVAGSIGAGMGALFNASGRTYYILEHKTQSRYHNVGDSQKIIIDQIVMGRAGSCQVRWEDTSDFEMVSRKHAAIEREGDNWKLINLSDTNDTIVNGGSKVLRRGTNDYYYLQSGDEIQLAVNGPRMLFIVPQGKQALTSSIRLTERMNLFRQQALRPYRIALWSLLALILLTILGFGFWNWNIQKQLDEQQQEARQYMNDMRNFDDRILSLQDSLARMEARMIPIDDPTANNIKEEMEDLQEQRSNVYNRYVTIYQTIEKKDSEKAQQLEDPKNIQQPGSVPLPVAGTGDNGQSGSGQGGSGGQTVNSDNEPVVKLSKDMASDELRDYYPNIYRFKLEGITVNGARLPTDANSGHDCGTAFVLSNGTIVTARQNVEPWVYYEKHAGSNWHAAMARFYANGATVSMKMKGYSTRGAAQKFSNLDSEDFWIDRKGDKVTAELRLTPGQYRQYLSWGGPNLTEEQIREAGGRNMRFISEQSRSYAKLRGTSVRGLPFNSTEAQTIAGGKEITIVGYQGRGNVHNLGSSVIYRTAHTLNADNVNGTIVLQEAITENGMIGAPCLVMNPTKKIWEVVGVYVGVGRDGRGRIVPINKCL